MKKFRFKKIRLVFFISLQWLFCFHALSQYSSSDFQSQLSKAASGDAEAMQRVGTLYFSGLGVQQSYTKAAEWYLKAAEMGQAAAASNLAHCYRNGFGVRKDEAMAEHWSNKADDLMNRKMNDTPKQVVQNPVSQGTVIKKASENDSLECVSKLVETVAPSLEVKGVTIDELFAYYEIKMQELNPALSRVHILFETSIAGEIENDPRNLSISVSQSYAPIYEVLKFTAELTKMKFRVNGDNVIFAPVSDKLVFHKYYTSNDWKLEAERLFPDLRDGKSAMSQAMASEIRKLASTNVSFFGEADWRLRLAASVGYKIEKYPMQSDQSLNPLEFIPAPQAAATTNLDKTPGDKPMSAKQIAKAAMPSVFTIVVVDSDGKPISLGSGFLVADKLLATNVHVISSKNAAKAYAINAQDGRKVGLVGLYSHDESVDIAIVELAESSGQPLTLATNSLPEIGEDIFVIGSPKGLSGTFSTGVVSALREQDVRQEIQISAPISSGSSGGPVLNSLGQVVGISVATIKSGQNLNFAIPVKYLNGLLRH